jgi:bilirubin oxidase
VVQRQFGRRMYHCHILEHESQGMMGVLDVLT